jgi:hypothetical protein
MNTHDQNLFVFSLNSDFTMLDSTLTKNELLMAVNPNYFCYFYCLQYTEFHLVEVKGERHVFLSPQLIVLKTFYPFHENHYAMMKGLLENVRQERLAIYEQFLARNNSNFDNFDLSLLDGEVSLKLLENLELSQGLMSEILKLKVPQRFDRKFSLETPQLALEYQTPTPDNALLVENCLGIHELIETFSFEDFIFLLLSMIKEKSIIFISTNLNKLTSIIMSFVGMLKPFRWPYPAIYSLPESCLALINSNYPVLIGLKSSYKYVLKHILPDKNLQGGNPTIFVFLDHNYIFTTKNVADDVAIPNFDGFYGKLKNDYSSIFKLKVSKNIKVVTEEGVERAFRLKKTEIMDFTKRGSLQKKSGWLVSGTGDGNKEISLDKIGDALIGFLGRVGEVVRVHFVDR